MSAAFHTPSDSRLIFSRWWIVAIAIVFIYGMATLITITCKAYGDKPPVPATVINPNGEVLFTGDDVRAGQEIFLRYGLMDNGSVWGHGAYLGPDFSAAYLHTLAEIGHALYPEATNEELGAYCKVNRYDPEADQLVMTSIEEIAYRQAPQQWADYFSSPTKNGGLQANLISDPEELRQLSAFFAWSAWCTIATRPGCDYSYTNNFPYEPALNNTPTSDALVWSAASLLFLLVGIGACMAFNGAYKGADWAAVVPPENMAVPDGGNFPQIAALVKFTVVVGLLFFTQTLVGGGVAHYRADPGTFYGLDLTVIFPSSLLRTWHLQLAIFWIATGFVVGGLIISRILGGKQWRAGRVLTNLLFCAFAVVIFGSLLSEWAGLFGWWDDATFWLGSQGWEYLELGRAWQLLMIVGFLLWAFIVIKNTIPAIKQPGTKPLAWVFLIAAIAIPVFYLPAIFYDGSTNFTVVDTWRFWVIHLWVEGFFEMFATVMVALVFVELGFVSRPKALRIIFLDTILTFMGGIIGTGHHWYFEGQTMFNLSLSSCFSALEVVPLILLALEAASFVRTSREGGLKGMAQQHKWTFNYFMAVGFWNFLGAGVFGFLINMPIVSYFEIGTTLTPNHGHTAMFGVFGFLALGLCVYTLRKNCSNEMWARITPWLKCSFWGLNIGLMLMVVLSLLPGGFMQVWDAVHNGYWHARSIDFTTSTAMSTVGWMRMPGDVIFILFGALPFFVAACKVWWLKFVKDRH
ncbi:MAG: cbb3-type cytochrome c oxidase subunit I [Bacteroidales bacterium]|nr:cbb3-type cytochrome c oxidase subunit I [Bacteroidales bacterium]